jgi:purine-binding chemotaxis protein CheW
MEADAASSGAVESAPVQPWAFFACSGRGYAVPLDHVHEIVPPQPLTRLPGCGPEVCGLIGLRGRVITVFDLGLLTGDAAAAARPSHRLVLLWRGDRVIGLAVDEIVTIAAPDENMSPQSTRADGTLHTGGRTFSILDTDRLFDPLLA